MRKILDEAYDRCLWEEPNHRIKFPNRYRIRKKFAKYTIRAMRETYPSKNVVMFVDTRSKFNFKGEAVKARKDMYLGMHTKGFDVWVFDEGTFQLSGDGGWERWGYGGNTEGPDKMGRMTFHKIV
jgi:hypothetical protein